MIVIRGEQMAILAADQRRHQLHRMCDALREQFPLQLSSLSALALFRHVSEATGKAVAYGLDRPDHWLRYLQLAVRYGWRFDQAPANAWMRACLLDQRVSAHSARLDRLLDELAYREQLAEQALALRARFVHERPTRAGMPAEDRRGDA